MILYRVFNSAVEGIENEFTENEAIYIWPSARKGTHCHIISIWKSVIQGKYHGHTGSILSVNNIHSNLRSEVNTGKYQNIGMKAIQIKTGVSI